MKKINRYKNLYCIIGASGSGKSSVANILQDKYQGKILCSYTTRPPRKANDTDHIYISEEEYAALKDKVATATIGGYHYCATKQQVDESEYYVVDWQGFNELLSSYKGAKKGIYAIYLECEEDTRESRMQWRGDSDDKIRERLKIDRELFSEQQYSQFEQYVIRRIKTHNISETSVAGVINTVVENRERKTK